LGHGSGQTQPPGHANVPADFNWKAYLLRYPDLRSGNIRTQDAAVWHYTEKGYAEHRSYERIPILLRYTACQGLFNQMYAHLNALVLADFLGADIMLPPSVYRESFSKYFSMDLTKNEVKWTPTDTGALLDVEALQQHYARKGESTGREGDTGRGRGGSGGQVVSSGLAAGRLEVCEVLHPCGRRQQLGLRAVGSGSGSSSSNQNQWQQQ
jgi:hypothetical protein